MRNNSIRQAQLAERVTSALGRKQRQSWSRFCLFPVGGQLRFLVDIAERTGKPPLPGDNGFNARSSAPVRRPRQQQADRWALAFFAAGMGAKPEAVSPGEALWSQGAGKAELGSYRAVVTLPPAEVAQKGGADLASVHAYLTSRPEAIQSAGPAPLKLARAKLAQSLAAYRAGDVEGARQSAITAYLEGFELIEASLDNVDATLRVETEREMMALRTTIAQGKPFELVAQQVERIDALLDRAQEKLGAQGLTPAGPFVSSLLILLREGLEAILLLSAIIAFVVKTGRRDALTYIHIGWIAAVGLGATTWVVATYLRAITGANREITEGVSALLAAAMLLYVGYWLHGKSYAPAWQSFIIALPILRIRPP